MDFPSIFEWLERFAFLRGLPAVYIVLVTAVIVFVAWDWHLSLSALTLQYLVVGLLFVDVLDPRLAIIKVLVGLFISLMLYMTARQVNWGGLPVDVLPEEAVKLGRERQFRLGPLAMSVTLPWRVFLAALLLLVVWFMAQEPLYQLPAVAENLDYLNLAVYTLGGLGLLGLSFSSEPLQAGMGMLMFLLGFELFFSVLEQSVTMLAMLAVVNFVVAVAVAYLTQAWYAIPPQFE